MSVQMLFETWDSAPMNGNLQKIERTNRSEGKNGKNKYLIEYYLTLFDFAV